MTRRYQKLVVFENGQVRLAWCIPPDLEGLECVRKGLAVVVWLGDGGTVVKVERAHPPTGGDRTL
jgi:hypothetical protein